MKITEIRQLSLKKLVAKLKEVRRALAQQKMHLKTGHSVETAKLGTMRRNIAQIQTLLTEKNNEANQKQA